MLTARPVNILMGVTNPIGHPCSAHDAAKSTRKDTAWDLRAACVRLGHHDAGGIMLFPNTYDCTHCGLIWTDVWTCCCDDSCSACRLSEAVERGFTHDVFRR